MLTGQIVLIAYDVRTKDQMVSKTSPHILIIDDDPVLAGLLKAQFEAKNFIVTITTDSWSAHRITRHLLPHVILLDTAMPEKDGFTILSELKHDRITRSIPVIVLAYTLKRYEREQAMALGAVNYLSKIYIRSDDIRQTIAKYMPRGRSMQA